MNKTLEVLIIGGGPAGLSAAMSLGRIGRTALVCDDARPRNEASEHLNNFPTQDGVHPAAWRKEARQDLEKYSTIQFFSGSVISVEKNSSHFRARFSSGEVKDFRKVILAYGIQDRLPPIPGIKELWGKSVFHCPYCHGFEVRNQKLGIIGNGKFLAHGIPMFSALSKDVAVFTNGPADFSEDLKMLMKKNNIEIVEKRIERLLFEGMNLRGIRFEDGSINEREALFATPLLPFQMKSDIGQNLGCEKNEMGLYQVNEMKQTSVLGVFAAGDNMTMMQSVLQAAASGSMAGAAAVFELVNEDFSRAD
ncbi:alkyl hydroperoxide reductase [Bdellovibrio bacteriovorus]|uniref:Alkyl hydroperoxide reductase n=1 Tax=Bdellovibrio bacteriovorus TaxID=959 RepID=A0A150WW07_BDEBC|nr:NAD(P)/FAD-dependent oxidoreductase [Bdellovibrio bacteriovorus]KYG70634.1 alkyl hydroperoxide reductase [Bdellovibrio bacteriovorus]